MNISKRIMALMLSASLLLTGCSAKNSSSSATATSTAATEKVLNIFTWKDYFPDDILKEFTESTGIKVNYTTFETNEEMLMKLQAAKGGDYDIILASDYILDIAKKEELMGKLDKTKIPNFANIDPQFQGKYYDETNEYTVPYASGIPLIIYNPDMVKFDVKGYADLWNPALKDSLVVVDDPRNIIGITLKTMGKSFNETDPAVLNQAKEKLMTLKPNVRAFDYSTPYNMMVSGEAAMGYMFTSQIATALQGNPNLKVCYPAEGLGFGIDSIFVPVKAPHADNACKFLDFILDGKRSAQITAQTMYMSCNKAATEFITDKTYVAPAGVAETGEFIKDVGDATTLYTDIWTQFKMS